jgi:hypothetical protein
MREKRLGKRVFGFGRRLNLRCSYDRIARDGLDSGTDRWLE